MGITAYHHQFRRGLDCLMVFLSKPVTVRIKSRTAWHLLLRRSISCCIFHMRFQFVYVVQLEIGYGKALRTILLTGNHAGELEPVTYQIPQTTDVGRQNKRRLNKITHEKFTDPFGILMVLFYSPFAIWCIQDVPGLQSQPVPEY